MLKYDQQNYANIKEFQMLLTLNLYIIPIKSLLKLIIHKLYFQEIIKFVK